MAILTQPIEVTEERAGRSKEDALCRMFDLFEDVLEEMTPEKRKEWLRGLNETVENLEKRS